MDFREEQPVEVPGRRIRGTALRIAGAGLVSVLSFGAPTDGNGHLSAGGPAFLNPSMLPGFSTLPAGWPGLVPDLKSPLEAEVWSTVYDACEKYGIVDDALAMYHVLWEESRFTPQIRSACGRYFGIGQFTRSTFRQNVAVMRRLGLIWGDEEWSPTDPAQAIEVMAWMWSQGFHEHWGPYRRVSRRLANEKVANRLN